MEGNCYNTANSSTPPAILCIDETNTREKWALGFGGDNPALQQMLNSGKTVSMHGKSRPMKKHPKRFTTKQKMLVKSPKQTKKSVDLLTIPEKHFKCDQCSASFTYEKDLRRHNVTHTGEKPFHCSICSKTYSRMDKLKVHERTHSGDKPYQCDKCNYAAVDGSSLKRHKASHLQKSEKPYSCQLCSYQATCSYNLTSHLRTHTGDCPYVCQGCSAKFKVKSDLNRHKHKHCSPVFACQYSGCSFTTKSQEELMTHVTVLHVTGLSYHVSTADGDRTDHQHQTETFKLTGKSKKGTSKSKTSHTKSSKQSSLVDYRCFSCNVSFVQETSLRSHVATHHPEPASSPADPTPSTSNSLVHDLPETFFYTHTPEVNAPMQSLLEVVDQKFTDEYGADDDTQQTENITKSVTNSSIEGADLTRNEQIMEQTYNDPEYKEKLEMLYGMIGNHEELYQPVLNQESSGADESQTHGVSSSLAVFSNQSVTKDGGVMEEYFPHLKEPHYDELQALADSALGIIDPAQLGLPNRPPIRPRGVLEHMANITENEFYAFQAEQQ